ncbi:hypothetical protein DY000_02063957 [Brassica cretica]|uniref:Uncharacterized protein n=1 Tax=Brassica cretica TaxID=69181 RepID=A0ABQ7AZC3_BRACR|nr:hypothetical protein DY000_02063957 [Brassica cretica]
MIIAIAHEIDGGFCVFSHLCFRSLRRFSVRRVKLSSPISYGSLFIDRRGNDPLFSGGSSSTCSGKSFCGDPDSGGSSVSAVGKLC